MLNETSTPELCRREARLDVAKVALGRTMTTVSNILAPICIIAIAKDFQELVEFCTEQRLVSCLVLSSVVGLFIFNLHRLTGFRMRLPALRARNSRRRILVIVAIAISVAALTAIAASVAVLSTTGAHYAIIASALGKESAGREVAAINRRLDDLDARGLDARAWASRKGNPWYSIVVGGRHLSKAAAEKTLERARQTIPGWVREDAWIRSYYLN